MKLLSQRTLIGLLLFVGAVRLVSIGLYPLGDTTEARYGEVARLMLVTNDWITPYNDPGVPFWAKPPLSTWAQAASMAILGVNEFAARLSSVLFAIGIAWLLYALSLRAPEAADAGPPSPHPLEPWLALLILATLPLFFMISGAVMTDMALAAAMALSMAGFWFAFTQRARAWGYVFFAGLGLSLLAKGPVGVALTGAAIGLFWLITPGRWPNLKRCFTHLPWVGGVLLMLAIALPWYAAAEVKTPGFIEYFIVGEHFRRFLEPGWKGDLYGNAHVEPKGMIWVFLVYSTAPWLPLAAWAAWDAWRRRGTPSARWTDLDRYLLAWTLATPLFFTPAGNTIWSYALPSMAPFALLLARRCHPDARAVRWGAPLTAGAMAAVLAVTYIGVMPSESMQIRRSTRYMVELKERTASDPSAPLYSLSAMRHSTKFYSRATAIQLNMEQVAPTLARPGEMFMIVDEDILPGLPLVSEQMRNLGTYDHMVLLHRPK
jgi:4-amino-4-deoxy-L-arabinose transferase-like glycosyltransferase